MSRKSRFSPFLNQCYVTGAVCCNVIGHGCLLGFLSVLLPQLHIPGSHISLSPKMQSWIVSALFISMFIGNFMTPPIMGRLGRKPAHYVVTLTAVVGWVTMVLATTAEVLLIGRVFHGISFGMMLPLRSVLIGEYTSPRNRGGFLTTIALAQYFGILFVCIVGSILSFQLTALICISFSFISFVMTVFSPESPSWLATKGHYNECRKVFIWLREEEEMPELENMIETSKHLEDQRKNGHGILSAVKKKEFYKPICLMFAVLAMSNFAGDTLMEGYLFETLHQLMGPAIDLHFWIMLLEIQRLIFNILAVFVINFTARRTILFATGALCASSYLAQATYLYAKKNEFLPFDSVWIPGVLLTMQVVSVSVGMAPLPSVIAGEVFPLQYRSLAGSISVIAIFASTFLRIKTFPVLVDAMGFEGTFVLYYLIIGAFLVVSWYLMPETKDKTLQEIEEYFRGKPCHRVNLDGHETEKNNGSENWGKA